MRFIYHLSLALVAAGYGVVGADESEPLPPFALPNLTVTLNEQQTVQSVIVGGFEMAPNSSAHVSQRLGDVSLRVRKAAGDGSYAALTTSQGASVAPIVPPPAGQLAAATIALSDKTLVLSIVAGLTMQGIAEGAGVAAVVRAMPNTPAMIGLCGTELHTHT